MKFINCVLLMQLAKITPQEIVLNKIKIRGATGSDEPWPAE
jgi:hypothetical protein